MLHVDIFIDQPSTSDTEQAVKEWLNECRKAAMYRNNELIKSTIVTCTYRCVRYRCVGASRLGDVWLNIDMNESQRYTLRVDVAECSDWKVEKHEPH